MKMQENMQKIVLIVLGLMAVLVVFTIVHESIKKEKRLKRTISNMNRDDHERIRQFLHNIQDLDNLKKTNNLMTLGILLSIVSFFLFIFLNVKILCILSVILLVIFIVYKCRAISDYTNQYKVKVIASTLKDIDSNLMYMPNNGMLEDIYISSELDNYDTYSSEDLIKGKIFDLDFQAADIHTQDRSEDSDGNTNYTTSFIGMFMHINLQKNIDSNIIISTNHFRSFNHGNKVLIDNENFNKVFTVFSDKDIMTLRILTPDVTNKIIDMYEKIGIYFQIKIRNNEMFFRFSSGNMFEPTMSDEDKEIQNVYIYKHIFMTMQEITKQIVKTINELEV